MFELYRKRVWCDIKHMALKSTFPRSAKQVSFPDWTIPATPDVSAFFSAIALAGFEGVWFRMTAADQRALLGCKPFGNCAIKSDGSTLEIFRTVCFGTDYEVTMHTGASLAALIASKLTARPGIYGGLK